MESWLHDSGIEVVSSRTNSFSLGKRNVPCTSLGFYLSDPGLVGFVFPKVIVQRSGREEVRYFRPTTDVPSVSVPVRIEYIEQIELHYRNHRNRVVFPIGHWETFPDSDAESPAKAGASSS